MKNNTILFAAINGFIVVGLGAFGAHGLKAILSNDALDIWGTAVQYHMFHTLALLIVGILVSQKASLILKYSAIGFGLGIVLFSGSLYLLALTGISSLGMITPLGGVGFLFGWSLLAWQQYRSSKEKHE